MAKSQKFLSLLNVAWTIVFALSVLCVIGCGSGDAASLTGKVTFNGEPVADGTIRLVPNSGTAGQGAGAPIASGSYEIAASGGLVAGEYKVVISSTREATQAEASEMSDGEEREEDQEVDEEGEEDQGDAAPKVQLIPAKYNIASTLTVTLTTGANTKDFDLEP